MNTIQYLIVCFYLNYITHNTNTIKLGLLIARKLVLLIYFIFLGGGRGGVVNEDIETTKSR